MSLLKIGGISPNQTAQPLQLGEFGEIQTAHYPSKSFYLGSVSEPVAANHVGSYGVFGVELINTMLKDNIDGGRDDNHILATKGNVYYIEKRGEIADSNFYLNYRSLVTGRDKRVPLKFYMGSAFPTTLINMGVNIAVVNRDGDGELFNAKNLVKVKDLALGKLKYSSGSKYLASNPTSFGRSSFREGIDKTWVVSALSVSCYDDNAEEVINLTTDALFNSGAYFSSISNISVDKDYIYLTVNMKGLTSGDGLAIAIIKKSTNTVVKILKDSVDLPYSATPVAYASPNIPMLSVERATGRIIRWAVSKDLDTFVPDGILLSLEETAADFSESSTSVFIVEDGKHLAIRTTNKLYLIDVQTEQLVWSVTMDCNAMTASVYFDGLGHIVFGDIEGNIYVANKFLQVQGYGVQA